VYVCLTAEILGVPDLTGKYDFYKKMYLSKSFIYQLMHNVQGGSNMTGTDLCVNKPHCAAAVRP